MIVILIDVPSDRAYEQQTRSGEVRVRSSRSRGAAKRRITV